MSYNRRERDIKAPDGYLLGGLRLVRKDATLLFHRVYFDCPKEWVGQKIWVHVTDPITLNDIEAAPPGEYYFSSSWRDRILLYPAEKPEAKSLHRKRR